MHNSPHTNDKSKYEYVALIQDDESLSAFHGSSENLNLKPSESHLTHHKLLWWIAVPFALLLLVDIAANCIHLEAVLNRNSYKEADLELRNQYIGLDYLYRPGKPAQAHYPSIFNRPRLVARVESSNPYKASSQDQPRWMSDMGTVTPPDLHFKVSKDVHTIYQFRVIDYGMESCQLTFRVPPRDEEKVWVFPTGVDSIDLRVCALDAPKLLDPRSLSWASRPTCTGDVGMLRVSPGEEVQLPSLPCSWGSHVSYEVSCAEPSPHCFMDVMSTHNETWGMFMYQHQSI